MALDPERFFEEYYSLAQRLTLDTLEEEQDQLQLY
jgi:hypothetical protein